jgi:WhiB family redox-sensing transcriptional regulator
MGRFFAPALRGAAGTAVRRDLHDADCIVLTFRIVEGSLLDMTDKKPFLDVPLPNGPQSFSFEDPWRAEAACKTRDDVDPMWWFPDHMRGRGHANAIRICMTCPVRSECLEYALTAPERHGIWGGMNEGERRVEIRRREREAAQATSAMTLGPR